MSNEKKTNDQKEVERLYIKAQIEKAIKKEIKNLKLLFKEMDKERMKLLEPIFYNAGFMAVHLKEASDHINKYGRVEEYQNGAKQKGIKRSTESEFYNSTIKNFLQAMKVLTDQLDKESATKIIDDGFDSFVKSKGSN